MFRPHRNRPLAARKGALPGKLQDVLAPASWGQKKLELARWSQFGLPMWGQEHQVESIRAVRSWLAPWITLQRWWAAWSNAPRPRSCKP
jgi:hypothetical protein